MAEEKKQSVDDFLNMLVRQLNEVSKYPWKSKGSGTLVGANGQGLGQVLNAQGQPIANVPKPENQAFIANAPGVIHTLIEILDKSRRLNARASDVLYTSHTFILFTMWILAAIEEGQDGPYAELQDEVEQQMLKLGLYEQVGDGYVLTATASLLMKEAALSIMPEGTADEPNAAGV